jgi:1-acyl-sn-glycerol-3-phosphate acyltransferase
MTNLWNKVRAKIAYSVWWICHEWLFDLGWFVGRVLVWIVSDCTVIGRENIPRRKVGVLMTINHLSMWDLPFVHNLMYRSFFTMAKAEFFNAFFVGGLVRFIGTFPVKRGKPDRKALQYAIDLLKKGETVVMFPEGHRSDNFALGEGHAGAALVAINSDALIIPVGIYGTENIIRKRKGFFARPKVVVTVGKPYKLSRISPEGKKLGLEELIAQMMQKIAEQLPPEYHGLYSADKTEVATLAATLPNRE